MINGAALRKNKLDLGHVIPVACCKLLQLKILSKKERQGVDLVRRPRYLISELGDTKSPLSFSISKCRSQLYMIPGRPSRIE